MLDELRDDVAYAVEEELSISKWSDCSATFAAAESVMKFWSAGFEFGGWHCIGSRRFTP